MAAYNLAGRESHNDNLRCDVGERMNVGRGLFRAWIVISVLWIAGAGIVAYGIVSADTVRGSFQPTMETKGGLKWWDIDCSKPFYETMREWVQELRRCATQKSANI